MDLMKRSLAPIPSEVWSVLEEAATRVLKTQLCARRFVDVAGPKGLGYAAVGLGRLDVPGDQPVGGVQYGVHRVQPLVETRTRFQLDIWELDNVVRGAEDVSLDGLIHAARAAANFEDRVVFRGLAPAGITGLDQSRKLATMELSGDPNRFLDAISLAMMELEGSTVGGPYTLVLGPRAFRFAASCMAGYPLLRQLERLVNGPVLHTADIEGGFLVSRRGGDFELTLGQDFTLGYESHEDRELTLFLSESFTFRVLEPLAFVPFEYRA